MLFTKIFVNNIPKLVVNFVCVLFRKPVCE